MRIYVDGNHRCHAADAEGRIPYDVQFFDGKAPGVIECYEYYPEEIGTAERIKAVMPTGYMDAIQRQYEIDMEQMRDMADALEILGVTE